MFVSVNVAEKCFEQNLYRHFKATGFVYKMLCKRPECACWCLTYKLEFKLNWFGRYIKMYFYFQEI